MAGVKRSLVISAKQDAFLRQLHESHGWNRSQTVRVALDKLMRDPVFFVGGDLSRSTVQASLKDELQGAVL